MRSTVLRVITFAALLLVAAAVSACGSDPTATPTAGATNTPTPTLAPGEATPTPSAATATPTQAPDPSFDAEAHFRNKTIRLVVGYNPGGGTDTQARFLASRLPEYIPGNPRISVSNLTPALAAANFVWESEANGLTLIYNATSNIQTASDPNAVFTASEFTVIGAPVERNATWIISGALPYDDITDAIDSTGPPLIGAGSAPSPQELTGVGDLGAFILADFLNLPLEYKLVAATGTDQELLMMERGDTNMWIAGSVWYQLPQRRPGWLTDGFVKPFTVLAGPGGTVLPNSEADIDVTYARELLTDEQKDIWDGLMGAETFVGKNLQAPPGMSPELTAVLRQAWDDAIADPDFKADFEVLLGQPMEITASGAELQERFRQVEASFERNADKLEQIQTEVYDKFIN